MQLTIRQGHGVVPRVLVADACTGPVLILHKLHDPTTGSASPTSIRTYFEKTRRHQKMQKHSQSLAVLCCIPIRDVLAPCLSSTMPHCLSRECKDSLQCTPLKGGCRVAASIDAKGLLRSGGVVARVRIWLRHNLVKCSFLEPRLSLLWCLCLHVDLA